MVVLFLLVNQPATQLLIEYREKFLYTQIDRFILSMEKDTSAESSSNEIQESKVSFATSNKGKPLLIFENFLFKCNKTTALKKYWLCVERGCCVYVHTTLTDELVLITNSHNHAVDPDQLAAKHLRDKMKERILAETTSITKIYDEEVVKAKLSRAATAIMPTITEYRTCYVIHDGEILYLKRFSLFRFEYEQSTSKEYACDTIVFHV